jgi:hypothetical protein
MATIILDRDQTICDGDSAYEEIILNPGVVSGLIKLKSDGHTIVMATADSEERIARFNDAADISHLSDYCFGKESITYTAMGETVKDLRKLSTRLPVGSLDNALMIGNYDDAHGCTSEIPLIEVLCNKTSRNYWNFDKVYTIIGALLDEERTPAENFDLIYQTAPARSSPEKWGWALRCDPDLTEKAQVSYGGFSYEFHKRTISDDKREEMRRDNLDTDFLSLRRVIRAHGND